MQKDWNKDNHGFRFDVIEYCGEKDLNEREKYWIDHFDATNAAKGYNQGWIPYHRKIKNGGARKPKRYHKTH